jgi:hypothetical protein
MLCAMIDLKFFNVLGIGGCNGLSHGQRSCRTTTAPTRRKYHVISPAHTILSKLPSMTIGTRRALGLDA